MLSGLRRSLYLLLALFTVVSAAPAQTPVRVAIVGLEHGHVAGFLPQLPKHPEVRLVGVSDPDASLRQKYATEFHLNQRCSSPAKKR